MAQIKRLLENPDIKRRKVQKKEIEEEKLNQLLLQKMFKLKTIWLKLMKNILVKLQKMII